MERKLSPPCEENKDEKVASTPRVEILAWISFIDHSNLAFLDW